jgi:hypothetical protein
MHSFLRDPLPLCDRRTDPRTYRMTTQETVHLSHRLPHRQVLRESRERHRLPLHPLDDLRHRIASPCLQAIPSHHRRRVEEASKAAMVPKEMGDTLEEVRQSFRQQKEATTPASRTLRCSSRHES